MPEPREQLDPYWDEIMGLTERLSAVALRLFREKGCNSIEDVLPGTGISAIQLVTNTIDDLIERGHWVPGTEQKDPFPMAYTALKRDFLDLKLVFENTSISDNIDKDYKTQMRDRSHLIDQESPALWIHSLKRYLRNDPQAIRLLELQLEEGIEANPQLAEILGLTIQDVINIKRRIVSKALIWKRLWRGKKRR